MNDNAQFIQRRGVSCGSKKRGESCLIKNTDDIVVVIAVKLIHGNAYL